MEERDQQNTMLAPVARVQPMELMRISSQVADACREIVTRTAVAIRNRRYVRVEGWEAIAITHGCFAGAGESDRVYNDHGEHIGYKANGYVRNSNGQIISTGEGFVGFDEKDRNGKQTWANRDEYAGRAMAQTRAISRACRSAFAHVIVLIDHNLSTTPAEEVPDGGFVDIPTEPVGRPRSDKEPDAPQPEREPYQAEAPPWPDDDQISGAEAAAPRRGSTLMPQPEAWRNYEVTFGKCKGKKLSEIHKNTLFGYWANYEPKQRDDGSFWPSDIEFRAMLDQAGQHYKFRMPEDRV